MKGSGDNRISDSSTNFAASELKKLLKVKKSLKIVKKAILKKVKKVRVKKKASWLKKAPTGCSKCRNIPGCTLSCWILRGGAPS
jgi:hypothetical protein